MRIGIFGGTFDPPHLGHLILAAEACDQMSLDRILWVVTPVPPHKTRKRHISPLEARLTMTALTVADDPAFQISRVELDRPGPHYTADTLRLLQEQYPGDELFFLMGGDSLHDLPGWVRPQEILASVAGIVVMRRPQDFVDLPALEGALPGIVAKVHLVDAPLLEISSTSIRQRVAEGRHFRYFLPGAVYQYIQEQKLYQPDETQ